MTMMMMIPEDAVSMWALGLLAVGFLGAAVVLRRKPRRVDKRASPTRVLGCFDLEDDDCSAEELWERQRHPRASVGGLMHSLEFQQFSRKKGLDVDKEQEKLAAFKSLRKCDPEGFKRLLSKGEQEYKAYDNEYLSRGVAILDYLFLILGIHFAQHRMEMFLWAWALAVLWLCFSQSTLLTFVSKNRGYYVCDTHHQSAGLFKILLSLALELMFVYFVGIIGVVVSLALKVNTKKRQGLMEILAGIWVIREIESQAEIG